MKGIVNQDLNRRTERPSVNATVVTFFKEGQIVNVVDAVTGDEYDGDDLWYKLDDGSFVWSGGVDLQYDELEIEDADRSHYLIVYREVQPDGRPDMGSKRSPDSLYFTPLRLPANDENIRVNRLMPELFANGLVQAVNNDPRQHVVIYIHGYQMFSSLKLDLFNHFVSNYMGKAPHNNIAKAIFMTWPAFGLSRKELDDRAIALGEEFTKKNFFDVFTILSDKLRVIGKSLNLIVHSFGNQLLNGMLNPGPKLTRKIFANVFIMAGDVTHLVARKGGVTLDNRFGNPKTFDYAFSGLDDLADKVYVYHDKYDYLLYASTKKFMGARNMPTSGTPDERRLKTGNYRNLGNYGNELVLPELERLNFSFVDVGQLLRDNTDRGTRLAFPFRDIRGTRLASKVDSVISNDDYDGITGWHIIFNSKKFADHHRYLFTCKPVVESVLGVLRRPPAAAGGAIV